MHIALALGSMCAVAALRTLALVPAAISHTLMWIFANKLIGVGLSGVVFIHWRSALRRRTVADGGCVTA
jgi:hypothetical protein